MTQANLSRLEKVDLRTIWNSESGDFTPWLAQEENLALLGETIGLDLELEAIEKRVGSFRADILCRDTATDSLVLVENQLECTDHKHLGQIFTYGAGLDAVIIIWVAARFTEEHRAALDWLNEITNENVNFFGLEVELWRIGDSPVAPKFNIVSNPNDWSKTISSIARGDQEDLTETKQLQLEYWQAFHDLLQEKSQIIRPRRPRPQPRVKFAIGRSKFQLMALVNTRDNCIGVALVLTGHNAKSHFHLLKQQKAEIEDELGASLDWRELPATTGSRIFLMWNDVDPTDKQLWTEQQAWLLEKLEALHKTFAPRVKKLKAEDYVLEEDSD